MENKMFCFQCEQTAGCTGCTQAGVCGKSADTARLQDELTGALIGLARATEYKIAKEAVEQSGKEIFIAGNIGPVPAVFQPDFEAVEEM